MVNTSGLAGAALYATTIQFHHCSADAAIDVENKWCVPFVRTNVSRH